VCCKGKASLCDMQRNDHSLAMVGSSRRLFLLLRVDVHSYMAKSSAGAAPCWHVVAGVGILILLVLLKRCTESHLGLGVCKVHDRNGFTLQLVLMSEADRRDSNTLSRHDRFGAMCHNCKVCSERASLGTHHICYK
jgi:hypothetical protein